MANRKAKPIRIYEFNQTSFNNNGICTLFPKSAVITRGLNEYEYYLDLTHPIDETEKWKEIVEDRIIVANGQPFRIKYVQKTMKEIVAYCEQIFFDLNNNLIEDTNIKDKNGNMALNQILSNTTYQHPFKGTSNIQTINSSRLVRKNVLSAIIGENENSFVNRWGGELDIDGFSFKINTRIGQNNGYKVEYSKNMTGINAKFDMTNVVTKILPVGFDGIKLDELFVDSPYIDNYAMPIIREYKYEDVKWKGSPNYQAPIDGEDDGAYETKAEAQAELRRRALAEFSENKVDLPTVTYSVNFVELSNTEEYAEYQSLSSINIGDDVTIKHKILGIDIPARCIAYKYNCLTCNFDEITLGHYNKNFFSDVKNAVNDVNNFKDTIQELPNQLNNILQQSKEYVTDYINGGFGGYVYYTPNAIYILDNPDVNVAKNVAVFNMNGLGFSNNGINGTFETAITRDGHIVADFIDTGILTADIIKTGILESKNGKSWLNMLTGDFNFGNKVKYENGKFEIIVESSDGGNTSLGNELSNMNNKIDSITHAPTVELTGEQAFLYENNFSGTPTPSSIKISARVENVTNPTYKWYFKRSGETSWTALTNTNNYNYYNVSHNDSKIFNNSNVKNVTFKCAVGDVYDEFTIVKVSSGSNGTIGNDGVGITEIQEQYYLSTSQQNLVGGTWQNTAPTWVKGKYIWTRTRFTYSNGDITTTSPICVTGKDGDNGSEGTSVSNVDVFYYQSTSATVLQGGSWTTTAPTWVNGKYIWSKTITYLDNGTQIESDPICITGERGQTGNDAYTVLLSNESHTFPSTYEGNIENAITTTTVAIAYKGKTSVTPTIGTLPTVTGLSLSKSENVVTIIANKGTSLADTGTFKIPVIVDGITFEKTFSWNKSKNGLSGTDGEDGYTVFLTNENFTFVADDTGNITKAQSTTTNILAYKGSKSLSFTIGTLPTVSGLTLSKTTDTITIKANTGTSLADVGSFDIIINADGKSFTKKFSWSKTKTGASGSNAEYVTVTGEQVFKYTNNFSGTPTPSSITLTATKFNTTATGKWQYKNASGTWTDCTSSGNAVTALTLNISPTSYLLSSEKQMSVRYIVGSLYDEISIVKVSDGAKGDTGATGSSGIGISSITEYYAVSSSNTTVPTSWSTTVPTMTATNKYLWNYETITYSNNTTKNTSKRVIGVYGDKGNTGSTGATGNGISQIANYYLATSSSSGVTTSTSGWTTTVQVVSASKKYLWNYEVVTYTNGSTSTTTPCIIGTYGDKGDNGDSAKNVTLTATSQVFKSTDGGKNFTPDSITIKPTYQNVSHSKWQHSLDGGKTWVDTGTNTNGVTIDGNGFTISKTSTLFTDKVTSIVVKDVTNNSSVYDTITITRLYDVTDLQIGGKNMVKDSKMLSSTNGVSANRWEILGTGNEGFKKLHINTDSTSWIECQIPLYKEVGTLNKDVTVSFEYQESSSGLLFFNFGLYNSSFTRLVELSNVQVSSKFKLISSHNGWKYVSYTFNPSSLTHESATKYAIQFKKNYGSTGEIHIRKPKLEYGTVATDWTPAPEDIDNNIKDVKDSLSGFQDTVNTSFKDGIIEQAEAKAIAKHIQILDAEKSDVDKEYSTIYGNSVLSGTVKTNLASAKTAFDNAHASLKSTINTVIEDGKVTSSESASVNSTFATYNSVLGTYRQRVQEALDYISSAKVNNVEIGGRNLARKGSFSKYNSNNYTTINDNTFINDGGVIFSRTDVTNEGSIIDRYVVYEAEKEYTISFKLKTNVGTVNSIHIYNGCSHTNSSVYIDGVRQGAFAQDIAFPTDNNYHTVKLQFKAGTTDRGDASTINTRHTILQPMKGTASAYTMQVLGFKIEKGNKATDWSPAPEDLENAYTIVLTNEAQVIPTDNSRKPTSSTTYYTDIQVYQGTTQRTDYTIGTINGANGITVSKTSSRVNFAVSTGTALTADGGNFTIPITIDGKTFNKTFSWSCSKQGSTGNTGNGINTITEYYAVSSSNTTAPTSWSTTVPNMTSTNKYLWNYEVIKYTDNTTKETAKRVIGAYGDKGATGSTGATGATGNGISKITNYYLASSSSSGVTTSTSGWTTSVQSVSSSKKYLWNYEVVTYTNGSTTTTTPCIIGAYGDTGDGAKTVSLTSSSQVFKSTDGGLTFTPDNIVITPNYQNVSYSKWQYSTNGGSSWTDVSSSTNGVTYSSTSLTVSKSSTLFTDKITSIIFKIVTNNSSVTDTMTITRLYDVADLEIGGRNLISKSYLQTNNSSGSFDEATNTWNLTATAGAGGTWGCGLVIRGQKVIVPYGKTYILSFEIKVPRSCSWNSDVNNYALSGSSWSGNDNDETSKRKTSSKTLKANQWIKCWVMWSNTSPNNTDKVDLCENSNFGIVMKDETSDMTYQIRNVQGELGTVPTDWTPCPSDMENAYTIVLTNEAQVIPTNSSRVPTSSTTYYTDIVVYQGTTQRTNYTIGTINSANGITVSKTSSRVNFAVSTGTTITADGGNFTIPITIDNKTFNKTFSWSCSKQGATGNTGATGASGADAYTVILTNESHTFATQNNGNISSAISTTTQVLAYKGASSITPTIGTLPTVSGLTLSKSGTTVTIQANTGTSLADSGSFNIPVTVDGKSFTKTFSWSKSKQGSTGATGANGTNAKTVDIMASTQVFKSTDGGATFFPDTITLTPSLQNVTFSKWQYSTNGGSSWSNVSSGSNGLTVSGNNLQISKSSNLFTSTNTTVVFKVITNDSAIYDTMTIVKLYDVTELEIGGRNLLLDTQELVNKWNNANGFTTSIDSNGFTTISHSASGLTANSIKGFYSPKIPINKIGDVNNPIVFSVDLQVENTTNWDVQTPFIYEVYNSSGTRIGWVDVGMSKCVPQTIKNKTWTRITYKRSDLFTGLAVSSGANLATDAHSVGIRLSLFRNGKVWYRKPKFEIGNISTDWSPAPEDGMDNLLLGGTNLMEDTRFENGTKSWTKGATISFEESEADKVYNNIAYFNNTDTEKTWQSLFMKPNIYVKAGEKYTFSFDIKGINIASDVNIRIRYYDSSKTLTTTASADCIGSDDETITSKIVKNQWTRITRTVIVPKLTDIKHMAVGLQITNACQLKTRCWKLEKGNKATDWSAHPNDVEININNAINPLIKTDEQLTQRLDNAFSDDVITAYEKIQIASDLKEIDAQYHDMTKTVKLYNDSSITGIYNEYKVAYNNLHTALDSCLKNMDTDTKLSNSVVKDAFLLYGTYYSHLRSAIDDYIKGNFDITKSSITSLSNSVDIAISKSSSNEQNLNTIAKHMKFSDEGWLELFATTNGNEGRFKTKITDTKLSFTDNNQEVAYMSNQKLYINYAQINNDLQIGSIVATKSDKGGIVFKWQ